MSARKTVLLIIVMLASFSGSLFAAGLTIPVGTQVNVNSLTFTVAGDRWDVGTADEGLTRRLIIGEPEELTFCRIRGLAGEKMQEAAQQDGKRFLIRYDDPEVMVGEQPVEGNEIPDVVGDESPSFFDGSLDLFSVRQTTAVSANRADRIVSTMTQNFCQQGVDIFIQIEFYRRHLVSDCPRISLSRRDR